MPPDASDPPGPDSDQERATSSAELNAPDMPESPSMEFLRDLAHVSDQAPRAFDLQLARDGGHLVPNDPVPSASGRFLIRRRLGAGGFGTVYEALDRERGATVALKALRRRDGQSIARFKSEFRSLTETVHPNLVQFYELHVEGDEWLFTMEFIQGEDALAYVRPSRGSYDSRRLRSVFRQLADGLSFLHRSGKLHRDLKPSNVMVTDEDRVVIVDFGLVSDIHDRQTSGGVFGTPAYMAPEQAAGLPVGPSADWYAVGVMLYQALTGRLPAHGGDPPEADRPAPPPSALAANVPDDLDSLCVELLARAPERRPTGAEVRRRLAGEGVGTETALGSAHPSATSEWPGRSEAPFVGRAAHLAALGDALTATVAGASVAVLLHGRSGIGKSALVQRFLGELRARDPGRLVLFGRCFEQESVPYKGVDGLVDDLFQALRQRPMAALTTTLPSDFPMLARLFPQLRDLGGPRLPIVVESTDDPLLRPRAFAALRQLLGQAAPIAPVLVVDDLQWADLDSAALLAALLHGPGAAPLLLVTTYRTEDAASNPVLLSFLGALAAIKGRVDVRQVEVGALDDHEAEALSRSLLDADRRAGDALSAEAVQALIAEGCGDPFLLTELAQHDPGARPDDALDLLGDVAGAKGLQLGTLLAARISGLTGSVRLLLEVVALEGQPISREVAASAAYGSERASEALGSISVLRAARLIRNRRTDVGDEILPYHDRIREMVTRQIDPDARRGHHHRLALALEASSTTEPEQLLFHYRSAGRLGEAARYALDAARRAHKALAFDRAARLYREALALDASRSDHDGRSTPQTPPEIRALRVALADALVGAGRPRDAALAYLEAVHGADLAERQAFRRRAAELFIGGGYADEGFALLRDVLREVGVNLPASVPRAVVTFAALRLRLGVRGLGFRERPERAVSQRELLRVDACYTSALGLFQVNPILAAESQARHLLLALEVGEPFRVARALGFEAVFTAYRLGPGPAADRLLATARGIEARVASPHLTGLLRLGEGLVAVGSARWKRAHDLVVESESVLRERCSGVSMEIDLACTTRAHTLWLTGDVAELARAAPVLVQEARERGNRFLEMMVQLFCGPLISLAAGRPDRAKEAIATALARWPHTPGSFVHAREIAGRARIALYERRGDVALAWIEEGLAALRGTGLILARSQTAELRMLRALAALSVGENARAASDVNALARLGFVWAHNFAVVVRAGLARRAGDLGSAIALMGSTRRVERELGSALGAAAMSRRIGEWTGGHEGRAEIAAADAWMAGQGIAQPERITAMMLGEA